MRERNGPVSAVAAISTPAATISAMRQPNASTSTGMARPAITPPSGTPACLIENTKLRCAGGVNRCSTSLPAGLAAPFERPITMLAKSASASDGTVNSARLAAPSSRLTWKAKTPPSRWIRPMPAVSMNSEPITLAAAR